MSRDDAYLVDILEAARLVVQYVQGKTLHDFLADVQVQDAVIRRFEIIGEAARRVSEATREQNPDLPWSRMIGLRNVVVHEYDGVDLNVLWHTAQQDVPALIRQLESVLPPDRG